MKRLAGFLLCLFALLYSGCVRYPIHTSWKASNILQRSFNKILVVGIIKSKDQSLRSSMEVQFVNDLRQLGYSAVSALDEFGPKGLANLSHENTYIMLCNKGIDGVITVALRDSDKEKKFEPARLKYYSNLYYYNRLWNYQKMQADFTGINVDSIANQYRWEGLFFDVTRLEPIYTIQTQSFTPSNLDSQSLEYGKSIIKAMQRAHVLRKQTAQPDTLRAF